jgi:hypothetical protein
LPLHRHLETAQKCEDTGHGSSGDGGA